METIVTLHLEQLLEPKFILRELNKQSVEYMELRDSIKAVGLSNCGCARYTADPEKFEIVDGWFRFNAKKDIGHKTMPFILEHLTDVQALTKQVTAQAHRPETKPVQLARHLKLLQKHSPNIRLTDMATIVQKSTGWVCQMLSLLNLVPTAQRVLERDGMPLHNGYMLAKLPELMQPEYLKHAQHMKVTEFESLVRSLVVDIRVNHRTGRLENSIKPFRPTPYLRTVNELLEEVNNDSVLKLLPEGHAPGDAWMAALNWALHLDRESVDKQKSLVDARRQKRELERKAYVDDIDAVDPDP